MIKKFVLFLIPFLFCFGFIRIGFGNQKFLLEWNEVIGEVSKAPDIPKMFEEDIKRINEVIDNMKEKESLTSKLWQPKQSETENETTEPNFFEQVLGALTFIWKGVASIFTAIIDFFTYAGDIFWLIANAIYLAIDTLSIPIRYIIWVFNSYILNPGT